ncbi:type 1 glutamine amidotransferase domain-containing protein [Luteimonas sp. SJ-92]|uniref:Type 1 glutamine amidotransferase domain-containing protein n=1 Tax=Luteimonas salinisoli TaxID=2752307 RepID=A0A853JEL8_9GAMM|nr:type 1 glutamine amidotransferase domain-containing protein [Luteimonas salinisoli]NZA27182.1 type 1 glutamine amidotransferase domain-containing protein [Luteimonas salinisoli]
MPFARFASPFVLVAMLILAALPPVNATADGRVLIVVSGEGRDQGRSRPGFEMEELSQAWAIFRDNGLEADIASPRGGAVEADRFDPAEAFNARFLADATAQARLADTLPTAAARAEDYAAIYIVGGKGAMFDLPRDPSLAMLVAAIHDRGGVVAAVCHGPAALIDVRLADGSPLVAGRALTGFTNEEEAVFGKRWAAEFPFLLEDAMRERGARWQEAPLMMPKLVVDGRLITGQNPYSTIAVAEAIVGATGRVPVARTPSRDERSMALVERLLAGDGEAARTALAADPAGHHVELIALLGFYQLQSAQDQAAVRDALTVMELAVPHFSDPRLMVGIAEGHWRLGRAGQARELLRGVLSDDPAMTEASELLARIDGER